MVKDNGEATTDQHAPVSHFIYVHLLSTHTIKAAVETPAILDPILGGREVDLADDVYQPGADMDGSADEDQLALEVVAAPRTKPP